MARSPRVPLAESLLALLWLAALVRIFWPDPGMAAASGGILTVYIAVVFTRVRRQMQILFGVLGALAVILAVWLDGWGALWQGVEKSVIFAAFFGTLTLLRATADQRLGAAEACQRGMCLACLWSPFWIAMAMSYEHLPQVPLWQVLVLGLSLNALGLVTAQLMYTRDVGMAGLGRALAAFLPVVPPVALAAAVVLALKALTPFGTLQCLVLGVPVLCLAALAVQGRERLWIAVRQSATGIGAVRAEISLLTAAMALGQVLVVALEASGFGTCSPSPGSISSSPRPSCWCCSARSILASIRCC